MLASIHPLGERGRQQRYGVTVAAFVAASATAGAAFGALLGALGAFAAPARPWWLLAAVAAAGAPLPGPHRQVNEDWLVRYRGWVYGAGFGAQLGLGVTTIVPSGITWLVLACAFASGSVAGGAVVGAAFGVVRALPILLSARVHDPATLRTLLRRVDALRPVAARAAAAVHLVAAAGLGAAALGAFA
jgi:hypothetical protein